MPRKVITIVGARPQFVKAAVVSRIFHRNRDCFEEKILHTGQHYDDTISGVFFRDLGIPRPAWNLEVGSASHGSQTGRMLERIEQILKVEVPDWVLVYGDTNSTLAGALAAAKLNIPLAHVEAGMRCFRKEMPEEINRVLTDHLSDLNLAPTRAACRHLSTEGIQQGVHWVGDVMLDAVRLFKTGGFPSGHEPVSHGPLPGEFLLATIHRAENTDNLDRFSSLLTLLGSAGLPVILPVHPRTGELLNSMDLPENIQALHPLPYLEMLRAIQQAAVLVTDSGGAQKEAFWLDTPCITLRDETEWIETTDTGRNILVGDNQQAFSSALNRFQKGLPPLPPGTDPHPFGEGHAAEKIIALLKK